MLLHNYSVEQCLVNGSFSCVKNTVNRSPTGPLLSSALPYYIVFNFPKLLIKDYHKLFFDKPSTWAPISMANFQCEN